MRTSNLQQYFEVIYVWHDIPIVSYVGYITCVDISRYVYRTGREYQ